MPVHHRQTASFQSGLPRHAQLEPVWNWTKLGRKNDLELVHRNSKTLTSGRAMFLSDDDVMVFRHKRGRQ